MDAVITEQGPRGEKGMKHYGNIESRRQRDSAGKPYYPAYSNLGVCRIYGHSGSWDIRMGNSAHLMAQGLAGMPVWSCIDSLDTVTVVLEHLRVRETTEGSKRVACI